jgi:electron transfer flavoprotein alpha subunit
MSILIYAESVDGKFKKVAFELASYGKKVAESMGTTVTAVTINAGDVSELGKYGVDKVLKVSSDKLAGFTAKAYADVIKQAAKKESTKLVFINNRQFIPRAFSSGGFKCRFRIECGWIASKHFAFSGKTPRIF